MKTLLDKLSIIRLKYEKLYEKDRFNIFRIIRRGHEEEELHSKFIYELLNPNGTHGLGNKFAEAFIGEVDVKDFNLENYKAYREYKKIDVLLKNANQVIIIENKIYAEDQNKQLQRYYDTIEKEVSQKDNIHVFYLTLNGSEASEQSIGNLDKDEINVISYQEHINTWLERCIEIASKYPTLRETLIQYQKLIQELTGQNTNQMETEEIVKLLAENEENIISASLIGKHWTEIKISIERKFWEDLEQKFKKNKFKGQDYFIFDTQKYSEDYFYSVYWAKKNKYPYYGIVAKIYEIDNYSICIDFERGWENIYYGLTLVKDDIRSPKWKGEFIKEELNLQFQQEVENIKDIENDWWFDYRYTNPKINFTNWNETSLKLINKDYRTKIIDKIWNEVSEYLEKVDEIYQKIYS